MGGSRLAVEPVNELPSSLPPAFALLIGVDRYDAPSGLRPLQGCANDARAVETLLQRRLGLPDAHLVTLIDAEANVSAVNMALERLARLATGSAASGAPARAGTRPRLWVFFAGYGSQVGDGNGGLTPSLVLYDSRTPAGSALHDLRVADLLERLEEIAAAVDVTLILDCGYRSPGGPRHTTFGAMAPVVRACPPDVRRVPGKPPIRRQRSGTSEADLTSELTIVSACAPGAMASELPVRDLEGTVWRGALTLALEQQLLALPLAEPALPVAGRRGDAQTKLPLAPDLQQRIASMGIMQRPVVWGVGAMLRDARRIAEAQAPRLAVQAEEAGCYWVDGGTLQGLVPGSRLGLETPEGTICLMEVVESGLSRCGCVVVEGSEPEEFPLPARLLALPLRASEPPRRSPPLTMRLESAILQAPFRPALRLVLGGALPAEPAPDGALLGHHVPLDLFLPAASPAGLDAWPACFRPVTLAGEESGPIGLSLTGDTDLAAAVSPERPLRITCSFTVPGGEQQPEALLVLAWDGVDFHPVARARLSPPPPVDAAPAAHLRRQTAAIPRRPGAATFVPANSAVEHTVTIEIERLPEPRLGVGSGAARLLGRAVHLCLYAVADVPEPPYGLFEVRHVAGSAQGARPASALFTQPAAAGELHYTTPGVARPGERVALLLHGLGDDGSEMVTWLLSDLSREGVVYDRVLACFLDRRDAGIEQSATHIAEALHALGFAAGNAAGEPPVVDLFGYNLGALAGRWLVERLGGDRIVDRCVFFGPPNGGTPLAESALLTPWYLATGVNTVLSAPPVWVAAWALGREMAGHAHAADLAPSASLIADLARAPGPVRTRYHVVAGDIGAAQRPPVPAQPAPDDDPAEESDVALSGQARRFVALVKSMQGAEPFGGSPHDGFVTVQSALTLRAGLAPGSMLLTYIAPVHHLGYFASPQITRQVARWLTTSEEPVG